MQRRELLSFLLASAIAPACGAAPLDPTLEPASDPAPFAQSRAAERFWPVSTNHPRWNEISYQREDGTFSGNELRRFNAPRPAVQAANPTRRHVGVDIFANPGDAVIAVETGVVVGFYPFLRARTGEMSWAIIVAHDGYVATYGEVREHSLSDRNIRIGDTIAAGREIAEISDTAQLHFETYIPGTTRNQSWRHGASRPSRTLNPTRLLIDLARNGNRVRPSSVSAAP